MRYIASWLKKEMIETSNILYSFYNSTKQLPSHIELQSWFEEFISRKDKAEYELKR